MEKSGSLREPLEPQKEMHRKLRNAGIAHRKLVDIMNTSNARSENSSCETK